MPDWLGGMPGEADAPEAELPTSDVSDSAEPMPDWLQEASSHPTTPVDGEDVPAWLRDEPDLASGADLPGAADTGLPAWLHGAELEESPAHKTEPLPASPAPRTRQQASAMDETSPTPDDSGSFFGGADLPAWLRPPEQKQPAETGETLAVNWLSKLPGVQEDDTDVSVTTATPTISLPLPTYSRSPAQREAASLLKHLVAAPYPKPAPAEEPAPLTLWQRIGLERVLYTVLALALLFGSLFPGLIGSTGLQTMTPNEGNIGLLAAAVDDLSDDDVVLLAYEWDAQRISELEPLENAITQHLIEQEVGIVSVSTDPQGTLLSFELRDALQAAGYQGKGFDYICWATGLAAR
ncbi:MAG: hypothetical protein HC828_11330 [Blastochloris sp.]|nr:hypothetical protein [Blastochloris sp.]